MLKKKMAVNELTEVEKRFHELSLEAEQSIGGLYLLSDKPMHDGRMLSCAETILLGNKYAGMLHSFYGNSDELDFLIKLMSAEEKNLKGIVIAGDDNLADNMESKLKQCSIPLVKSYRDNYKAYAFDFMKEVIVNPPTQEVLMYSKKSGFLKLN
jgi:hypothetical protein